MIYSHFMKNYEYHFDQFIANESIVNVSQSELKYAKPNRALNSQCNIAAFEYVRVYIYVAVDSRSNAVKSQMSKVSQKKNNKQRQWAIVMNGACVEQCTQK